MNTTVEQIVDQNGGESYWSRVDLIQNINPAVGEAKQLLRRIVEVGESGLMLVYALRRALEVPEQNQIEVADLDWFIPAMIGIAEDIEIQSWSGEEADYGRLLEVIRDETTRMTAIARLRNGEFGSADLNRWLGHQRTDPATRANKLALVLSGELERALEPFEAKVVSWEVIRNIANSLTNQLYLGVGVDIAQAHMSDFNQGPRRGFTLEEGRKGHWRQASKMGGWSAFDEVDVSWLYWESLTSGNALEATKVEPGKWELRYSASPSKPTYRGLYYGLYKHPESVQKVDAAYVYQNA